MPPRFFIQPRAGVKGGEVSWEQMARHLDLRTLAFYSDIVYVLWGCLSVEHVVAVARFLH